MKTNIDIEYFLSDIWGTRYLHLKKVYLFVHHLVYNFWLYHHEDLFEHLLSSINISKVTGKVWVMTIYNLSI